jgi:hypothetical protein
MVVGPVTPRFVNTSNEGGVGGLPLPLLLQAARYGGAGFDGSSKNRNCQKVRVYIGIGRGVRLRIRSMSLVS